MDKDTVNSLLDQIEQNLNLPKGVAESAKEKMIKFDPKTAFSMFDPLMQQIMAAKVEFFKMHKQKDWWDRSPYDNARIKEKEKEILDLCWIDLRNMNVPDRPFAEENLYAYARIDFMTECKADGCLDGKIADGNLCPICKGSGVDGIL